MKPLVSFKSNPSSQIFQPFLLCCLVLSVLINIRYIFFSPASFPEATDSLNIRVNSIGGYNNGFFSSNNPGINISSSSASTSNSQGGESDYLRRGSSSQWRPRINPTRSELDKDKYLDPVPFDSTSHRFSQYGLKYQNKGSCVCGPDKYCLCTPSMAIDCIIEYKPSNFAVDSYKKKMGSLSRSDADTNKASNNINNKNNINNNINNNNIDNKDNKDLLTASKASMVTIVAAAGRGLLSSAPVTSMAQATTQKAPVRSVILIRRRDPPSDVYAIPGGFVDIGESAENATIREMKEELHLTLLSKQIKQFKVYSDPLRDKRRHTVSVVFHALVDDLSSLKQGSDAKAIEIVPLEKIKTLDFGFDHKQILMDYFGLH